MWELLRGQEDENSPLTFAAATPMTAEDSGVEMLKTVYCCLHEVGNHTQCTEMFRRYNFGLLSPNIIFRGTKYLSLRLARKALSGIGMLHVKTL